MSQTHKIRGGLLFILWVAAVWAGRNGGGGDLQVLWESVSRAWSENWTQVYIPESDGPFFYPPFALLFFGFFAFVKTFSGATLLSLLFHSLSFWGFWILLRRLFPALYTSEKFRFWLMAFTVAIAPMHLDFMGQNIQLPIVTLLLLAEYLSRGESKTSRFLAGLLSAWVSVLKVFPVFVTVTYFFRKDRLLTSGILTGWGLAVLLPLLFFGMEPGLFLHKEFLRTLLVYHDKNLLTLNPGVLNLPSLIATWSEPWLSASVIRVLVFLLPVLVGVLFMVWLYRASKNANQEFYLAVFSTAVALMALLNSSSRPDYFVFFVPAFAWLGVVWDKIHVSQKALAITALLLIAFTQQGVVGKPWNIQLEFWRLPVVGMVCLCLAGWMSCRKLILSRF